MDREPLPCQPDHALAFDMLHAVADHAHDAGLRRTAALAEAAMDAWISETRAARARGRDDQTMD